MRTILGVTFYPRQCAMHGAIEFHTERWGCVCIRPPIVSFGHWRGWYLYVSPDGTPGCATFAMGPGLSRATKREAAENRRRWGHNYPSALRYDYERAKYPRVVWEG